MGWLGKVLGLDKKIDIPPPPPPPAPAANNYDDSAKSKELADMEESEAVIRRRGKGNLRIAKKNVTGRSGAAGGTGASTSTGTNL